MEEPKSNSEYPQSIIVFASGVEVVVGKTRIYDNYVEFFYQGARQSRPWNQIKSVDEIPAEKNRR